MRIEWIQLEAYGAFSNQRLTFRPDARLHIVYGANEAGKSTALAAVGDLLFGLRKKSFDFLHKAADLRLSAKILNGVGESLEFRRALYKPQLTDLSGEPLSASRLEPFLGALDREAFVRAFGLDAQSLRKSGEELLSDKGELGAALFAAASGLRGMTVLKQTLEAEAEAIIGKRASKNKIFDQALERFARAKKALFEHETRSDQLKALHDEIAGHALAQKNYSHQRAQIAERKSALERLRRTAPLLREIAADRMALENIRDTPPAPLGAGHGLAHALGEWREADRLAREAQAQFALRQREVDAVAPETPLLQRWDDIERLNDFRGRVVAARDDLPRLEAEYHAGELDLSHLARRVGLLDAQTLRARSPSDAILARVEETVKVGAILEERRAARQEQAARIEQNIVAKHRAAPPAPAMDPKALRAELKILDPARLYSGRRQQTHNALEQARADFLRDAEALEPSIPNLEEFRALSLPSPAALEVLERDYKEAFQVFLRAQESERSAQISFTAAQTKLTKLNEDEPLPTLAALRHAREKRVELFRSLVTAAFDVPIDGEAGEGPTRHYPGPSAKAHILFEFDAAQREVDRLADAIIAGAARIGEHGAHLAQSQEAEAKWGRAQKERSEAQTRLERAEQSAKSAWRDWPCAPQPHVMLAWRERVAALKKRDQELQAQQRQLEKLDKMIFEARQALTGILERVGATAGPGPKAVFETQEALDGLFACLDTMVEQASQDFEATKAHQAGLAELSVALQEAKSEYARLDEQWRRWRSEFSEDVSAIGLSPQASLAEAGAALTAWSQAPAKILAQEVLRTRINGIERDARNFERAVKILRENLGGAWPEDPVEAASEITRRGDAARQLEIKRVELARQCERARQEASARTLRVEQARADLESFCARNFPTIPADVDFLTMTAEKLSQREKILQDLAQKEARLAEAGDGRDENSLRLALEDFDPDGAEAELARLSQNALETERLEQEAFVAKREAEGRLARLGDSLAAEAALQRRRTAESEMTQAARDYIVKKLGSLLIGAAIERQRSGLQAPVLTRAGEFFARLTGGAFVGVGQIYGDDDRPLLAGQRVGGARVGVEGLSEGARDQLFLSLRLAYLELYASANEAPPFLADDLFSSFDDARTAHGLNTLIEIGAHVQPILFTHHRFIPEIARKTFGDSVEIIELTPSMQAG